MSYLPSWNRPRKAKSGQRVPVSEDGIPLGEHHHRARYSDAFVEQVRQDHERGGLGYRRLARKYGVSVGVVKAWCRYLRRATVPAGWRTVAGEADGGADG